jgi:hypothetical protein
MIQRILTSRLIVAILLLLALLAVFLPTLQTIVNGSDHYFMIDVGETQVVLNVWGTLHYTGYPLYVITGSAMTALFRTLGANPAAAASLVSLVWGLVGLGLVYALADHLSHRPWLAAAVALLYGLTRTYWIHTGIAEIYGFGFVLLMLLLVLALWQTPIRGRVYWLALVGGMAVAHHRSLAFVAPALVLAVWPQVVTPLRTLPRRLLAYLGLGLLGFLPYIYLPLRAWAGATWVYGFPGTWWGFWEQFFADEASRFVGLPDTPAELAHNVDVVNSVLLIDLTLLGLLVGLVGLGVGLARHKTRKPALVLLVSGLVSYLFHAALYTDVMSALVLQVTVSVAFGWLFLGDGLLDAMQKRSLALRGALVAGLAGVTAVFAFALIAQNKPFIENLTQNPTGVETIALVEGTPPDSTLMIAWGYRHFAAGYAHDVLGQMPTVTLVDHNADFARLIHERPLITPDFTFYNYPAAWWEEQTGGPVALSAVAPGLVRISPTPDMADGVTELDAVEAAVVCDETQIQLRVTWVAPETPTQDLSVFVHLLTAEDGMLAQADQSAPVYSWRPLTGWLPNEAIHDIYALPRLADAARIRFGLYHQNADGSFENVLERTLPVDCATGD